MQTPRFEFVALLLAALCAPSSAEGSLSVLPKNPTTDDFVKIKLRVPESPPARFLVQNVTVIDREIFISLEYNCFTLCTRREDLEFSIGKLPAGRYRAYADRFENFSFDVVEPLPPTEDELPRVELAISPAAATDNDRVHALIPIELRSCQEPEISTVERPAGQYRIQVELPADDPTSECGRRMTAIRADLGQLAAGTHTVNVLTHVAGSGEEPTVAATETFTVADAADAVIVQGSYRLSIAWQTPDGNTGDASPVALSSTAFVNLDEQASALFTYFDPTNWETLVKVLDGCAINGHRWVFLAAATDVEFTLTVDDLASDLPPYTYTSPAGSFTPPLADTSAIPCVP